MPTPYETLGLKRDATAAQIKSAYLKLAKKHHPDLNPGDKKAEERFKAISAAHDLLGDADKRARFDRGEIDGSGQAQGSPGGRTYRHYAETDQGARYRAAPGGAGFAGAAGGPDLQDMFADLFANARQAGGRGEVPPQQPVRGQDQRYQLAVGFIEAVQGANRRLTLPDGRTLDVTIPAGLEDGQVLRLRGQGDAGWNGAPAGDALIEVGITPHAFLVREGDDIHLDLPVTASEAASGAKVAVPTPGGQVTLRIPHGSDTGRQLRLRGRGIPAHAGRPAGDLYVTLQIVLGTPDQALEDALRAYYERNPLDPRHMMGVSPSVADAAS